VRSIQELPGAVVHAASVQAVGLTFAYGDTLAVDDISFDVAPGEVLGVLGPNGAGKSTTIRMLTGQLTPAKGSIRILGMDMPGDRTAIQGRIGVCFEEKNLYLEMTARENLAFFATLFGVDVDVDALLERVGLRERGSDRVSNYSKGMRQRLMITRALINTPDVLFLDEPTDGLDPVSARGIRDVIRAEADRGAAVLLTTHDMHEADELSNRVAFIDDGRVIAMDAPEELKLAHGQRSVRVRRRVDGQLEEEVIELDRAGSADHVRAAVAKEGLLTVHTEEATLEDIFVQLAGRGLSR
jgi:ABC-2 type transport system ATP-binding protein